MKKKDLEKQNEDENNNNTEKDSDDKSSLWSKESVILKVKKLSDELDKKRKERAVEKQER